MKINKYPDGSSYAEVRDNSDDEYNNYTSEEFTFKINSYENLWHLNQIIDAYNHQNIHPIVTIPNLIDAQADRRFGENQSSGLKLICKFLNSMNATFEIFHPHNAEVVEALMDNVVIIDNIRYITQVLYELGKEFPARLDDEYFQTKQHLFIDKRVEENTILMSSDAGGFKPLMKLCDKLNWKGETFSASKYRVPHDNLKSGKKSALIQKTDKQDFEGSDILIIDDISVYGGTFKGLSRILKQKNCGKLYLAVSHMTVQDLGNDPITNYFDKVFTTNSKFDSYYVDEKRSDGQPSIPKNLEIIKQF